MNRRSSRLLLIGLIVVSLATSYFTVSSNYFPPYPVLPTESKLPYRACIVSLIRSDNLVSSNKLLNMLNSLHLYFQNIHRYPIYLFHESNLTNDTKKRILHCSLLSNIYFFEIKFDVPFASNRSGYASMCQFWSYDLWFKYDFVRNYCDYVLRFDDDSYLTNSTGVDLFEHFHQNQFDYAFRIVYHDTNGVEFLRDNLRSFLPKNESRRGCIEGLCTGLSGDHGYDGLAVYNNFFMIRVQLYYEYSIIKEYLEQLLFTDAFYRHRIGDANVQTICLFLINRPIKWMFLKFPYNHNVHGASDIYATFTYFHNTAVMWHLQMMMQNRTCRKVFMAARRNLIEIDVKSNL